jgi:hypothetical protein
LTATLFIALMVAVIFLVDFIARWWRASEWKRRWRKGQDD